MVLALTILIKEFLMKISFKEIVKTELEQIISKEYTACLLKSLWLRPANSSLCRHANSLDFNFTLEAQAALKPQQTSWEVKSTRFTSDQYWKCDRNQCVLYHFRNRSCPDLKCILIFYNGVLYPLITLQHSNLKCYLFKTSLFIYSALKYIYLCGLKLCMGQTKYFYAKITESSFHF